MLKAVPFLALAVFGSQAYASDIRYSYLDGGLSVGSEDSRTDFGDSSYVDSDAEYLSLRIRGSVGFGPYFYLPASIESAGYDYDSRYCEPSFCDSYEYSVTRVNLTVGAGLHFPLGDSLNIYGDVSLLSSAYSVDEDGGFDDEDDEDDDVGHQLRFGFRFQPVERVEFDLSFKRQEVFDFTADWRTLAVQVNFTPRIGVGFEAQHESFDDSDLERDYVGAYFRYSFR